MNLLFHVANTLLLFTALKRMTRAIWPSAFVAAVFGLHPLHVESVAWTAERKDVLSTFFWMLTMLAYAWYAERPKIKRYSLVLLPFVLGLMSKPMCVTLPFVLLLLDYWPLERMRLGGESDQETSQDKRPRTAIQPLALRYLLLEKIPLIVLTIASSIVTFLVQQRAGAMRTVEPVDLRSRLGNVTVGLRRLYREDVLAEPSGGALSASGQHSVAP